MAEAEFLRQFDVIMRAWEEGYFTLDEARAAIAYARSCTQSSVPGRDVVGGGRFTSVAAYEPMPHHREAAEQQKVKFVLRSAHWAKLSPGAQKQIAELTLKLMAEENVKE